MHDRKRDYPRSFGFQFNYQNHRAVGWARGMKGMGKSYKESVKAHYPAYITFTGYMEMTPNRDSYIDVDESVKDHYGLPSSRRHWKLRMTTGSDSMRCRTGVVRSSLRASRRK